MPFTRAGFNFKHVVVARAKVAAGGIWPARLIRFSGGDYAWYTPHRFLEWADSGRVRVWNLIGDQPSYLGHKRPCSEWPQALRG